MNIKKFIKGEKFEAIKAKTYRIFPKFWNNIGVSLILISIVFVPLGIFRTATIGQEMNVMLSNSLEIQSSDEQPQVEVPIISDFVVNGSDKKELETTVEYKTSQMCFIGDSRTVHMGAAVLTEAKFIAKSSMGLDWFMDTASVEFESIKNDVEMCVVALGINDIRHVDEYILRLNEFAEKYPDKIFIYANIGPVDENLYTGIPNSSLEKFNQKMLDGLSDRWQILDQYTYLSAEGFSSSDGLHYSFKDSAKIFAWMVDSIKMQTITIVE